MTVGTDRPSVAVVNPQTDAFLEQTVQALKTGLGANLYSCCLYGSAVRGNAVEGVSDLNLLIVLNESDAAAHRVVAEVLKGRPQIDPFVLSRRGFERSARAFAPKFASIRRNHRVLFGADPVADLKVEPELERFLCEQALRNLRLRMVYAFVTQPQSGGYGAFVVRHCPAIFVQLAEALRLQGVEIPTGFEARVAVFEKEFGVDGAPLRELLALKKAPRRFSDVEAAEFHGRLFPVVDGVLRWVEEKW